METKAHTTKAGWVSCDNLHKLENIQKEIEKETEAKLSFNGVIELLVHSYRSK